MHQRSKFAICTRRCEHFSIKKLHGNLKSTPNSNMAKSARCVPAVKYLKFLIETLRCTNCHVASDKDLNHRLKLAIQDMLDERRREIETVYIKKRFGAKTLICFVFSKAGKAKQFKCGFGRKQLWQFYQSLRSMLLIEFCDNFVSLIFGKKWIYSGDEKSKQFESSCKTNLERDFKFATAFFLKVERWHG